MRSTNPIRSRSTKLIFPRSTRHMSKETDLCKLIYKQYNLIILSNTKKIIAEQYETRIPQKYKAKLCSFKISPSSTTYSFWGVQLLLLLLSGSKKLIFHRSTEVYVEGIWVLWKKNYGQYNLITLRSTETSLLSGSKKMFVNFSSFPTVYHLRYSKKWSKN